MSQEKKQTLAMYIAIVVVVAGASFYGGSLYGKASAAGQKTNNSRFAGMMGGSNGVVRGANGMRGGGAAGEILKIDDKSITLKLADGGSKICYLNSSSTISKFSAGATSDLTVGTNVVVNGAANSDGTVTASMIQIGMPRFNGGVQGDNPGGGQGGNRPGGNQPAR